MMTPQEIIEEIKKLPLIEQKEITESILKHLRDVPITNWGNNEEDITQLLYITGVISKPPNPNDYTDEDDDFEPIEIKGKPLSETIIEDRG
ncbi:MAG: hypothetical protein ACR2MD_09280 [Aridibacter sp.]